MKQFKIKVNESKGSVDVLFNEAPDTKALIVLAHGAGANMHHQHMTAISESLAAERIATLRFNFPYMQSGGKRVDNLAVSCETVSAALTNARNWILKNNPQIPLFLGGHSFGGRMSSHLAAAHKDLPIKGLIYYSFPLHPSKKPGTQRASHLADINLPMLFLSGSRDTLAEQRLLQAVVTEQPAAQVHWLETADHGFKILKRTRKSDLDVYTEAAVVASNFIDKTIADSC